MRMLAEMWAESASIWRVRTAELEHGFSMMEAIAASEFEQQLRMLPGDEDWRAGARQVAIDAALMGVTRDEAAQAMKWALRKRWGLQPIPDEDLR
jgi:hypothetical protein